MALVPARLHDPGGTYVPRLVGYGLALASFIIGCWPVDLPDPLRAALFPISALLLLLSGLVPVRQAPADVFLELSPGAVKVRGAGTRNRTIRTRSITGATTARSGRGVILHLAGVGRGDIPLGLEVADDEIASQVRQSLGIGHHGFGALSWATTPGDGTSYREVSRWVGSLAMLVGVAAAAASSWAVFALSLFPGVALLLLFGILSLAALGAPRISVTAGGVSYGGTHAGWRVPWSQIQDITRTGNVVSVELNNGHLPIVVPITATRYSRRGMSDLDCEAMQEVVLSGARRARGEGPHKEEVAARTEVLRRAGGAGRDWLARLDSEAQLITSGGYRGSAVDPADLYRVMEDPEADLELRGAAARILLRVQPTVARVRVDEAIATVRSADDEAVFRVVADADPLNDAEHIERTLRVRA